LELPGSSTGVTSTSDLYKIARIEHYLRQAEDLFRMSRYHAARKALQRVQGIDPGNTSVESLLKRIDYQMLVLQRRNGYEEVRGGARGNPVKRRRIVMLVDQDENVLTRLSDRLRKYGFEPVAASDYQEAIDTLGTVTPDVMISEVNFENGPAGFDLFLWVRSSPHLQRIPFMFLATRIDREVLIAGKRLGVDDFLVKPMDDDVVAASVANCFSRGRRRQSLE
jgi:PleD family two-component response regulator